MKFVPKPTFPMLGSNSPTVAVTSVNRLFPSLR